MLLCCEETFVRLFYNISSYSLLIFIFIHFTFIFLAKVFIFFGSNPFYQSSEEGYEFNAFSDEEIEEEIEYYGPKNIHSVANIVDHNVDDSGRDVIKKAAWMGGEEEEEDTYNNNSKQSMEYSTPTFEASDEEAEIVAADTAESETNKNVLITSTYNDTNGEYDERSRKQEDGFLVAPPPTSQGNNNNNKRLLLVEEQYGDTLTIGSTSRSSINCSEDPFSSSSRRSSCPKWEETVFQKYDEEMLFLDRICVQKLRETETLRSDDINACPRSSSVSQRIAMMISRRSSSSAAAQDENPYHELEAAYVAQICLTWEALNWNRNYFRSLGRPGCPAGVAQQFQQFQVLLQRYVENEPYEHGPRPLIYARIRTLAPKLLQVPQFRDSEDDGEGVENKRSRIPSTSFIGIMDESIRTFMSFLKQDKKSKYQILADLVGMRRSNRSRPGSAHQHAATLILLLKKLNKKKKAKLNELGRSGRKCMSRKSRPKLRGEEELEILMAKIDLKLVSRVLRMTCLNGEHLHWCENKMSKLRIADGKLHRESSPLFFPAHCPHLPPHQSV